VTPAQLRDLTRWVEHFAAASDGLKMKVIAAILAQYAGRNFYSTTDVAAAAQAAAAISNAQSQTAAGLAGEYLAVTTGIMLDQAVPAPTLLLPALRNGVDMNSVFERPAKLFRLLRSQGVSPEEAFTQAMNRARSLATMNITLAQREAYQQTIAKLEQKVGVTGYRRVVHPELSRTGTCGLCIVASDNTYHSSQLLPIHGNCECTVLPIIGELDPGNSLNGSSLADFYAAAGDSTFGEDLKKTRYVVNEHGEYGPVLGVEGQHFLDHGDLDLAA
jgi:hypothetical protein